MLRHLAGRIAVTAIRYDEGDIVEHVEGRVRRHIYVEAAHDTGGNFDTSFNGRCIWSSDPDDIGTYLELDENGIVANRGKSGGPEKAKRAIGQAKIRDFVKELKVYDWRAELKGDILVFRYSPNAFSSHLSLTIQVADWATLVEEAGPVKCRLVFEAKSAGKSIKKSYAAKGIPSFRSILRAAEAIWLENQ
jgi:hypothetical protein